MVVSPPLAFLGSLVRRWAAWFHDRYSAASVINNGKVGAGMPTAEEIENAKANVQTWAESPTGTEEEEQAKFKATDKDAKVLKAAKKAGQL